jgi:hypothetical protein
VLSRIAYELGNRGRTVVSESHGQKQRAASPLHTNNSGQQLGGVFGVVGQDDAGAGAADAE